MDQLPAPTIPDAEWDYTKTFTAPLWVLWKLDGAVREVYLRLIATAHHTNWTVTPRFTLTYLCDVVLEVRESTALGHLATLRNLGLITWMIDGSGGRVFIFHNPPLREPEQGKRGPKARLAAEPDTALSAALSTLFAGAPCLSSQSVGSALDLEWADAALCGRPDGTARLAGTLTGGNGRNSENPEFGRNCKHPGFPGAVVAKGCSHG